MSVLWISFATTVRSSLSWLQHKYILAAALEAVSGPLSYLAGQSLGAIQITSTFSVIPIELVVIWALVTPLVFYMSASSP